MKFLAIIPARGGSKRLPGKNIRMLEGKPLIQYTIDVARACFDDKDICVSTDDSRIAHAVENIGLAVPFLRPAEYATDVARSEDVIFHALNFYREKGMQYDAVVLLQPTSPLRTTKHIKEAVDLYNAEVDMILSVKETDANPYFVLYEENEGGYLEKSKPGNFSRKQDVPKVYEANGALYVINIDSLESHGTLLKFKRVKKYLMDKVYSVDIDDELDWIVCETILQKLNAGPI